jgi:multicomponent Na+:H+ antiporter subunit G
MTVLGWAIVTVGAAILALSALGVLRLPGALARQHAATKAATLGLGTLALGVALLQPSTGWWLRLAILVCVLMATVPVASHALARATNEASADGSND